MPDKVSEDLKNLRLERDHAARATQLSLRQIQDVLFERVDTSAIPIGGHQLPRKKPGDSREYLKAVARRQGYTYFDAMVGEGRSMKSTLASAALLTSLCISPPAVQAHDLAESIVGTWKLKSFVRKELASGKVANFYGDSPTGYVVYTKSGHYITFVVGSSRKAPSSPNPTDTERLDLFKSMYAYSAKYTVQGTRLIYELDASWNEAWTGTKRSVSAEVAEDTLTITSPPYKSPTDGLDIVVINQWVRVD